MGMFNYLKCEYKLPLPKKLGEIKDFDFNKLTYQTKDLNDNLLDNYIIKKNGTLWLEREERTYDKPNPKAKTISENVFGKSHVIKKWKEKVKDFTGEIVFYESLNHSDTDTTNLKNDYWIEFKAVFVKSKLTKITRVRFDIEDNTERKKRYQEVFNQIEARRNLWNKWYMKYIYVHYDKCVSYLFKTYRNIAQKLPYSYKVERWLRFY